MKSIFTQLFVAAALCVATIANANDKGRLFIIGDATSYGWSLDYAQSLLSTTEKPNVYSGTIYLRAGDGKTFKFLEEHEFGGTEYGLHTDVASTIVSGDIKLATGSGDDGYNKLSVAQDGNYYITIDTQNLTGSVALSDYQESEINYCALYLIGSSTAGGWGVEDGTPLYQSVTKPYEFSANVNLKAEGSFKIATALKGAGSFDSKYFIFKDAADDGKISSDGTNDRQWSVAEDAEYMVTVNTVANTIVITKNVAAGVEVVAHSPADGASSAVYYNLQGCRVDNPNHGIYIRRQGTRVEKVAF